MLLALLAWTQAAPTITFESPGITVKAFCAELSRQTGRSYEARDEVQSELLAIRVEKVPIDELLKKLCFVDRAKVEFDGAKHLVRPDLAARADNAKERLGVRITSVRALQEHARSFIRGHPLTADEAKDIARSISRLAERIVAQRAAGDDTNSVRTWVSREDELNRIAVGETLAKMFSAIPPEELANIEIGGSAVWSTRPTSVEHPSPVAPQQLLAEFIRDERAWSELASPYLSQGAFSGTGIRPAGDHADQTAIIRLEVHQARMSRFTVVLEGFDERGKSLFSIVQSPRTLESIHRDSKAAEPNSRPEPSELPSESVKLIRLWSGYPSSKEVATWRTDSAFMEAYFNPEKHDPAAETFGRAMLSLARERDKALVAMEPASFASILGDDAIKQGKVDLAGIEYRLKHPYDPDYSTAEYASNDDWITIRPQDLEEASGAEFDRARLGWLLRTARDAGAFNLPDLARFASDSPRIFGPTSLVAARRLETLVPGLMGGSLLSDFQWPLLCFLGRLTDTQIAFAQRPEGLSLATCNAPQLAALWNAFQYARFEFHGQRDVWQSHPTDALPEGLPGGGALHLSVQTAPSLFARIGTPGESVQAGHYTPKFLAQRLTRGAGGELENSYDLIGVRAESNTQYLFHFDFPDEVKSTIGLSSFAPTSAEVRSIDQLPEPVRSQVLDELKKLGS